jgi:hypothetical protein
MPIITPICQNIGVRSIWPVVHRDFSRAWIAAADGAASPSGCAPIRAGRSTTSSQIIGIATMATPRPRARYAVRQPNASVRKAINGGSVNPPMEVPIADSPSARPRSRVNQRVISAEAVICPSSRLAAGISKANTASTCQVARTWDSAMKPAASSPAPSSISRRTSERSTPTPRNGDMMFVAKRQQHGGEHQRLAAGAELRLEGQDDHAEAVDQQSRLQRLGEHRGAEYFPAEEHLISARPAPRSNQAMLRGSEP